jgi:hypothetical protein
VQRGWVDHLLLVVYKYKTTQYLYSCRSMWLNLQQSNFDEVKRKEEVLRRFNDDELGEES